MASTTSSSSFLRSSQANHTRFDLFLSFRGEDTRLAFTDHLFHALKRAGLRTFRDDDEIERGEELKPEIERAIIQSRASIVVLSENYANSKWCLDELWLILDQRRKNDHFVLPVFYHVDPSDVRNQRGSFAIQVEERVAVQKKRKVEKGVQVSKWTNDNVMKWKAALTEVANLTGMAVSGSEQTFITEVVNTINYKLDLKQVSTPAYLTGMETRAEVINSWLKDEQSSTNVMAICGMGGGGKTTLAQYIYNLHKQNFESSSFVEEIGKHYKQPHGLIGLQRQILEDVLGMKSVMITSVSQATRKIQEVLEMIRVLIVLDDVDDEDELSTLLGIKTFHSQSKIIITTRILGIDSWFGSLSWSCWVCELELLNDREALELLSWYSFGSKIPMKGFAELAAEVTQYCEGNPLALKVLGSSLFVSDKDPSARISMIEIWKSRLNAMKSLKGDIHSKIQGVLQRSFDALPYNNDKELFLHIACFFEGHRKERVVEILEDDLHAKSGITSLINRCLLTVSPRGILKMHQLLQDMGRKMIRDESKNPAERSRVWCSDDAYRLLSKGNGSIKIEGLSLDVQKLKKGEDQQLAFKTDSLIKMKNLKLLELIGVELVGSYKNFPDLRWLSLCGCQLKTVPLGLSMSSLVALEITEGSLEKFELPKVLNSLKTLNLRSSRKLASVCGFSQLPKLETLILCRCTSLAHVCKTIGYLESLHTLDLSDCINLWKASSDEKNVNQSESLKSSCICGGILEPPLLYLPPSLELLTLGFCDLQYRNDVSVVFHAQSSMMILSLRNNPFEYLPDSINLKLLQSLDLTFCPNLRSLPCLPSTLQELYINWCTSLERITFQSAHFSLQEFGYEGCFSLSEIQGLFKLVSIQKIDEADLGDMQWLKAYQDHKVDLVGDEITEGRIWHIQMLYEYGIRSAYLQLHGIKDENLMKYEYMSSSDYLSFRVPLLQEKQSIQGLNLSCLYRSSGEGKDIWLLFARIRNRTKGLTWVYNPVVYCKPKVDEDVVWLTYWPIGNILDEGDEVEVEIIWGDGLIVSGCGASLVYMGDGEVGQKENCENNTGEEEVIGGDLSEFEVTTGGYYLCRRDLFQSTVDGLKLLFGDNIQFTDSQRWRKSRPHRSIQEFYPDMKLYKNSSRKKIEVGVSFSSEGELDKIGQAVRCLAGVNSISMHKETGRLYVYGRVEPETVAACVGKFDKMAKILNVELIRLDFEVGYNDLLSALYSLSTNH